MNSRYIFRARTPHAHLFKVLAEIMQSNLKTSCFQLKADGLYLRQMDENRSTLIDLKLNADQFSSFEFNPVNKRGESSFFIGLTLTHLYKLLKTVKKKDSLGLYLLRDTPTEIAIEVWPKVSKRVTTSFLTIQRVQNILVDVPTGYARDPFDILSHEFQKIYKDILSIGKTVSISATSKKIQFDVDAGGIVKRRVEYGEIEDEPSDCAKTSLYSQVFETEQFVKLSKMSNLDATLLIYCDDNLPMKVSSNVGKMGTISIFVKSRMQMAG